MTVCLDWVRHSIIDASSSSCIDQWWRKLIMNAFRSHLNACLSYKVATIRCFTSSNQFHVLNLYIYHECHSNLRNCHRCHLQSVYHCAHGFTFVWLLQPCNMFIAKFFLTLWCCGRHQFFEPWTWVQVFFHLLYLAVNIFCSTFQVSTVREGNCAGPYH
jgi:hypothetical protein